MNAKKRVQESSVNACTTKHSSTTIHLNRPQNMTSIRRAVFGHTKPKNITRNCAMLPNKARKHMAIDAMYTSFGEVVTMSLQGR